MFLFIRLLERGKIIVKEGRKGPPKKKARSLLDSKKLFLGLSIHEREGDLG